ncbi:MAG TPA: DUF934 domain-containing protein [Steroidobacteraceae bacterium]|nr:DUF934 domain-containing protein [Steroidobacteraceae bacterium]
MRHILRRREIVADDWRHLGEPAGDGDAPDGRSLIVPLAELRREPARWQAWRGRLGARLAPADPIEPLGELLPLLELVAVEFPTPGDGRGYSQGRLLRERLRFAGELRACGAGVRQDQAFLLARCGFDTLELAPGEDLEAARRALARYDVAYQPGAAPVVALRRQRFFSPG